MIHVAGQNPAVDGILAGQLHFGQCTPRAGQVRSMRMVTGVVAIRRPTHASHP
jgi:hypothetical protein